MNPGALGPITFDWAFFSGLLSIVAIDLILAGDNAVVIAMAVRTLPKDQRRKGILFGAGAAVILRVVLTFFVAQLLEIDFVKLVGGSLILWIAIRLFVEGAPEGGIDKGATSIGQAIRIIVIADITMALDNMLAVAGASHGDLFMLLFGLAVSIPFVVFTSNLLSVLMDKYPIIIYIGAAILGKVGGEMILTDPFVEGIWEPARLVRYAAEAFCAMAVILIGRIWLAWMIKRDASTQNNLQDESPAKISTPE